MRTQTFADRCTLSEQCLPDAPYRAMLTKLHKDMLQEIDRLKAAQEPVAWMRPDNRVAEESSAKIQFSRGATKPPIGTWKPLCTCPQPAQPEPAVQEPSQREFENWLRSKWTAGYTCQKLEGRYTDKAAQSFWECWQAATVPTAGQRKTLPKSEWPKHPSAYVDDQYMGYAKSDLDDYAMQVLAAHGITEKGQP